MEIEYQRHSKRKKKALEFWLQVASDYNQGFSASEIADKYTNPLTSKKYTRATIYWILKKVNKGL